MAIVPSRGLLRDCSFEALMAILHQTGNGNETLTDGHLFSWLQLKLVADMTETLMAERRRVLAAAPHLHCHTAARPGQDTAAEAILCYKVIHYAMFNVHSFVPHFLDLCIVNNTYILVQCAFYSSYWWYRFQKRCRQQGRGRAAAAGPLHSQLSLSKD